MSMSAKITAEPLPAPPNFKKPSILLKANDSITNVDNTEAKNDDSDNEEMCTCTSQQSTLYMQLQHSVIERNVIQERSMQGFQWTTVLLTLKPKTLIVTLKKYPLAPVNKLICLWMHSFQLQDERTVEKA